MSFNPFKEKSKEIKFESWNELYPRAYDKRTTDPYTKVRIILMNGTEYESMWFMHNMARHVVDNDLRRELAFQRRIEQQQQKKISYLKPKDESLLEHTISYEQLAVDLTAIMARREPNPYVKQALDFALLEDFDHLYRYADLLDMDMGIKAETLVGKYTEIMPGRPTVSEHRFPYDDVKRKMDNKTSTSISKLNAAIITAAEQQTMNYYLNSGPQYDISDLGRKLFMEIAMVEEEHVSLYESLSDSSVTWLECLLMHEYTECYLYYSMMNDEIDQNIKSLWESCFEQEIFHLHTANNLLKKYEKRSWEDIMPNGEFPELIKFNGCQDANKDYIRDVIANTVGNTSCREEYININNASDNSDFFGYNRAVNGSIENVASHRVIEKYIMEAGEDYRYQEEAHPIASLDVRDCDNTDLGRKKCKEKCKD